MSTTLTDTLNLYVESTRQCEVYSVGDDFSIIDNPSFAILPNHPYRSPLVAALFCTRGRAAGRVNTTIYSIDPGGFMVVLPGQITELINQSEDFEATYVLMTESFTGSLGIGNTFNLGEVVARNPYTFLEGRAREALECYLSMCRNLIPEERNPHRVEILRLLTRAFFLGLGYFIHPMEEAESRGNRQAELTNEFVKLVEDNYREHRDLKFYADAMGLTPKHISTVVKASSGKSAVEWIEKYVILDAQTQLISTDRTIKEIAYDLNFPSQSFFGKYFCRVVGISPAAYRNKENE